MSKPSQTPQQESWLGRRLEVTVGAVAHGGHCVARYEGRVIFVRHALPGEEVIVEVTEDRAEGFCRADAVEIVVASPDRVAPPCRYAHPGGCGGCDFQHASAAAQRGLKAEVVAEQFRRLAHLDVDVTVTALQPDALGWRRRVRYASTSDGRLGLRVHRSHQVLPIEECLIAAGPVSTPPVPPGGDWAGASEVELALDDDGAVATLALSDMGPAEPVRGRRPGRERNTRRRARPALRPELVDGPARLVYRAGGHPFEVAAGGFWQTHPAAAETFLATVLRESAPRAGERVLDLYAGAGLFTVAFAAAVTASGRVLGLEGDAAAAADGTANLAELPSGEVLHAAVTPAAVREAAQRLGGVDIVVLDPPRTGAGRAVMAAVLELAPRVVCYVACDPAALARDVATAAEAGWRLGALQAFDAFPMTHHVECVATLHR